MAHHPKRTKLTRRAWWPWFKRGATALFFILVAGLLISQARNIEWAQVFSALRRYPLASAWEAVLLAITSFTLYSCFDLLGRRYTGHSLSAPTVMTVTFVSYAFNLNLGSLVGGVAFRYRLYSRLGLRTGTITRVMSLSMLANWIGYLLLAGLVFSLMPPSLPASWPITRLHLRLIGLVLLAIAAAYLALCAFKRKRTLQVRGHGIELPSIGLASLQLLMGASNWLVMSGIIFILFQQRIEFPAVVSVLLLAAVAGVITHIPAGLGVLEAVFVALLSHLMPHAELLAALVAYRLIYYVTPLGIAAVLYLVMELKARQLAASAA
ncbi:lysylphosphatidylglycerol synthase domain-containing protein [Polaromonas sp.]|uniref:lysylphosphatidylglycerol synthase domain-containing protein n=1 Tax=Polaromonas sp. TaxID=1869339 RepID=UPI00286A9110|nr:lysylphosphatidylglycerol synthase domain-containing protein [Polaromonas sp.]